MVNEGATQGADLTLLVCSERSGSNLLSRCFDAHPAYCSPPPAHLARTLCDHRDRYGNLAEDAPWRELVTDAVRILDTSVSPWQRRWTSEELLDAPAERTLASLLRTVLDTEARLAGAERIFLKENHAWRHLAYYALAFPEVRVVWLVRDPRDMALSWKHARELRGEVPRAARVWEQDQRMTAAIAATLSDLGRLVAVRYEDLVDDPASELARVCRTLDVPFDDAMLDFHRRPDAQRHAAASKSWENVARPVMAGNHGKYRDGLSEDEIRHVEWVCGDEMDRLGYARDHDPAEPPDAEQRRERLEAVERWTKAEYQDAPEEERRVRAARAELIAEIAARPRRSIIGT